MSFNIFEEDSPFVADRRGKITKTAFLVSFFVFFVLAYVFLQTPEVREANISGMFMGVFQGASLGGPDKTPITNEANESTPENNAIFTPSSGASPTESGQSNSTQEDSSNSTQSGNGTTPQNAYFFSLGSDGGGGLSDIVAGEGESMISFSTGSGEVLVKMPERNVSFGEWTDSHERHIRRNWSDTWSNYNGVFSRSGDYAVGNRYYSEGPILYYYVLKSGNKEKVLAQHLFDPMNATSSGLIPNTSKYNCSTKCCPGGTLATSPYKYYNAPKPKAVNCSGKCPLKSYKSEHRIPELSVKIKEPGNHSIELRKVAIERATAERNKKNISWDAKLKKYKTTLMKTQYFQYTLDPVHGSSYKNKEVCAESLASGFLVNVFEAGMECVLSGSDCHARPYGYDYGCTSKHKKISELLPPKYAYREYNEINRTCFGCKYKDFYHLNDYHYAWFEERVPNEYFEPSKAYEVVDSVKREISEADLYNFGPVAIIEPRNVSFEPWHEPYTYDNGTAKMTENASAGAEYYRRGKHLYYYVMVDKEGKESVISQYVLDESNATRSENVTNTSQFNTTGTWCSSDCPERKLFSEHVLPKQRIKILRMGNYTIELRQALVDHATADNNPPMRWDSVLINYTASTALCGSGNTTQGKNGTIPPVFMFALSAPAGNNSASYRYAWFQNRTNVTTDLRKTYGVVWSESITYGSADYKRYMKNRVVLNKRTGILRAWTDPYDAASRNEWIRPDATYGEAYGYSNEFMNQSNYYGGGKHLFFRFIESPNGKITLVDEHVFDDTIPTRTEDYPKALCDGECPDRIYMSEYALPETSINVDKAEQGNYFVYMGYAFVNRVTAENNKDLGWNRNITHHETFPMEYLIEDRRTELKNGTTLQYMEYNETRCLPNETVPNDGMNDSVKVVDNHCPEGYKRIDGFGWCRMPSSRFETEYSEIWDNDTSTNTTGNSTRTVYTCVVEMEKGVRNILDDTHAYRIRSFKIDKNGNIFVDGVNNTVPEEFYEKLEIKIPGTMGLLKSWHKPYAIDHHAIKDAEWDYYRQDGYKTEEKITQDETEAEYGNYYGTGGSIFYRVLIGPDGEETFIDQYNFDTDNYQESYDLYPEVRDFEGGCKDGCPEAIYYSSYEIPVKTVELLGRPGEYRVELRRIDVPHQVVDEYPDLEYDDTVRMLKAEKHIISKDFDYQTDILSDNNQQSTSGEYGNTKYCINKQLYDATGSVSGATETTWRSSYSTGKDYYDTNCEKGVYMLSDLACKHPYTYDYYYYSERRTKDDYGNTGYKNIRYSEVTENYCYFERNETVKLTDIETVIGEFSFVVREDFVYDEDAGASLSSYVAKIRPFLQWDDFTQQYNDYYNEAKTRQLKYATEMAVNELRSREIADYKEDAAQKTAAEQQKLMAFYQTAAKYREEARKARVYGEFFRKLGNEKDLDSASHQAALAGFTDYENGICEKFKADYNNENDETLRNIISDAMDDACGARDLAEGLIQKSVYTDGVLIFSSKSNSSNASYTINLDTITIDEIAFKQNNYYDDMPSVYMSSELASSYFLIPATSYKENTDEKAQSIILYGTLLAYILSACDNGNCRYKIHSSAESDIYLLIRYENKDFPTSCAPKKVGPPHINIDFVENSIIPGIGSNKIINFHIGLYKNIGDKRPCVVIADPRTNVCLNSCYAAKDVSKFLKALGADTAIGLAYLSNFEILIPYLYVDTGLMHPYMLNGLTEEA